LVTHVILMIIGIRGSLCFTLESGVLLESVS